MADFSKQYCELHDMGFEGDFDIEEVATELKDGYYTSYICEGFGFTAIAKDQEGKTLLYFPDWEFTGIEDKAHWIEYDKFIKQQKNTVL
jgi:hypothetical protein